MTVQSVEEDSCNKDGELGDGEVNIDEKPQVPGIGRGGCGVYFFSAKYGADYGSDKCQSAEEQAAPSAVCVCLCHGAFV